MKSFGWITAVVGFAFGCGPSTGQAPSAPPQAGAPASEPPSHAGGDAAKQARRAHELSSAGPTPESKTELVALLRDSSPLLRYRVDEFANIEDASVTIQKKVSNGVVTSLAVKVGGEEVPFELSDVGSEAALALAGWGQAGADAATPLLGEDGYANKYHALVAIQHAARFGATPPNFSNRYNWDLARYFETRPFKNDPYMTAHAIARLRGMGADLVTEACACLGGASTGPWHGECPLWARKVDLVLQRLVAASEDYDTLSLLALGDATKKCAARAPSPPALESRLSALTVESLVAVVAVPSARDLLRAKGAEAVPALLKKIQGPPEAEDAYRSAEVLGEIGDQRAVGPLVDALRRLPAAATRSNAPFAYSNALARLTGKKMSAPDEWVAWWESQSKRAEPKRP